MAIEIHGRQTTSSERSGFQCEENSQDVWTSLRHLISVRQGQLWRSSHFPHVIRISAYLLCSVACFFQVRGFVGVYLDFPSNMDIQVTFVDEVTLPAISVCNTNWFKRSAICRRFPDLCRNKSSEQEVVVNRSMQVSFSAEDFRSLGHPLHEMVRNCSLQGALRNAHDFCSDTFWFVYHFSSCYTYNSQWRVPKKKQPTVESTFKLVLELDLQPEESMSPLSSSHLIVVYITGRHSLPKEDTEIIKVQPGFKHYALLTTSSMQFLGKPFRPDCTDYISQWKANGEKGPLSKEGCLRQCENNISKGKCGCVRTYPLFTSFDDKCLMPDQNKCFIVGSDDLPCIRDCLMDCRLESYDIFTTKDAQLDFTMASPFTSSYLRGRSRLEISLQTKRHLQYISKPKFRAVEILGYVGGYLSLWLGVSIPLVYGLAEKGAICFYRKVTLDPHPLRSRLRRSGQGQQYDNQPNADVQLPDLGSTKIFLNRFKQNRTSFFS